MTECACGRPATGHDARRGEATCRRCAHLRADGGHELVADDDASIHVDSFTVHRAGDDEDARPWGVSATVADRRTGRPYKAIKVEYDLDGTTAVLRSIHAEPFHVRDLPLVAAADDAVDALPFVNAVSGAEQELQQGPPVAEGSA